MQTHNDTTQPDLLAHRTNGCYRFRRECRPPGARRPAVRADGCLPPRRGPQQGRPGHWSLPRRQCKALDPARRQEGAPTTPSSCPDLPATDHAQADDRLRDDPNLNHEYLPIAGLAEFTTASQKLVLGGDSPAIKEKRDAAEGSIIVLHACAHNPTGVDATQEQWKKIADVIKSKKHFPFFDTAYQGFASGDLATDGWAIRYFVEQGFELCIAQSYAKNFGLYGERAGCFHFVTSPSSDAENTIKRIASQLAILQRSEISNPPAYGARIASTVLNDPQLFAEWENNLRTMSGRIKEMRKALRSKLEDMGTPGTWNHITEQIGMFSFTGLTEQQVLKIREDSHVYMTKNGRISMAGLNTHNIDYFAKAVDKVVRETQ
ncbi:Aspartate aminotransferase,cytoplasmic [Alternaria alternata]|nr:Aspartate aminotransferase,cytoplasmic [Alternaria alternata]